MVLNRKYKTAVRELIRETSKVLVRDLQSMKKLVEKKRNEKRNNYRIIQSLSNDVQNHDKPP